MFTRVKTVTKKIFGKTPNPNWRVKRCSWNTFLIGRVGNKPGCIRLVVATPTPLLEIFDSATPADAVSGALPSDRGTCKWEAIPCIMHELEK